MEIRDLENAIASDYRTLEYTIKRLNTRLLLHSGYGKSDKQINALIKARTKSYEIMMQVKELREELLKV